MRIPVLLMSPEPAIGIPPEPTVQPQPDNQPPIVPREGDRFSHPKDVECGFCESRVTSRRGEVIKMSERAKALAKAEHDVEHWKAEVDRLRAENTQLKESRNAPPAQTPRGWGSL